MKNQMKKKINKYICVIAEIRYAYNKKKKYQVCHKHVIPKPHTTCIYLHVLKFLF